MEVVTDFLFLGFKITADGDCSHEIRKWLLIGRKAMTNLHSGLKSRHYSADKDPYRLGLPSGHIWLWEWNGKEGRMPKNWCLRTVVLEKNPESPWDSKEIKPVNLKGDQPWIPWKDWCWSWSSSIFVIWCTQTTHWKSPSCWERSGAEGKGGVRGWDAWMASLMQGTWTWANSGRRWGTGKPGMLQSKGSQRVRHDWATEQQHIKK